ncbi:enolase C-terminal domain-like protein [Alienimonas californiensis]|uniref:L-Ala-D/L-Glu epimerase n=1 Tax=Alienimonas californiensis TaxID=2527989 RepID=A0A517PEG5_9PLAN|nr:enolase C-terminal domain-like protein [Alienimonas californiensis]QDT17751.1 L-Ala-D/L-Glu epimerase [Alienimonas californiensis]
MPPASGPDGVPRLARLTFYHVRVPLRRTVSHASHTRTENDALFVQAETDDGRVGWGEGLPREYVTGETIDSCFAQLLRIAAPPPLLDDAAVVRWLHGPFLPAPSDRSGDGNTVRCAVETAVLAAFAVDPVPHLTRPAGSRSAGAGRVQYGVVLTTGKAWKRRAAALAYRLWGFRDAKLKLGVGDDEVAARQARHWFGPKIALRADANEAWEPAEVAAKCDMLARLGFESVEQPVPRGREHELPRGLALPVVWDESVLCPADAKRLHALDPTCRFNLRLSKNGGLLRLWDVFVWAANRGIPCQLGCMVGEAGLLSAAGRTAAGLAEWTRLEGGYGRHLVAEQFTQEDWTFGRGGWADLPPGGLYPATKVRGDAIQTAAVLSESRTF